MRIAFFTDMFLPQINGVTTSIVSMAKKLADRGHHVYIIAPKFSRIQEFSYKNVTVRRCASVPALIYKDLKLSSAFDPWILKFVRDNRIEIVHFHTPMAFGIQAILVAKILGLPLVGTFHGFFMHHDYLKHIKLNYKPVHELAWRYSNFFYNRCDIVTCPSEGTRRELLNKNCSKPIKVIPYGIDTGVFNNSKSAEVRKALSRKGKLVLYVGRIAHEKNMPHLLNCFGIALKKVPTAKLVIVGDGPQMPDTKAKVAALGIENNVIFTGSIPHEKLVKSGIFGACDVFITASKTETGPFVILEAQANALVCIGVKGKGMGLIKNDLNGYVVDPDDKEAFANAIVTLLTDKELYSRMKKASVQSVKQYELHRIVELWENVYEGVVEKHSQRTVTRVAHHATL